MMSTLCNLSTTKRMACNCSGSSNHITALFKEQQCRGGSFFWCE